MLFFGRDTCSNQHHPLGFVRASERGGNRGERSGGRAGLGPEGRDYRHIRGLPLALLTVP